MLIIFFKKMRYTRPVLMKLIFQWSETTLNMYSNKYTRKFQVIKCANPPPKKNKTKQNI